MRHASLDQHLFWNIGCRIRYKMHGSLSEFLFCSVMQNLRGKKSDYRWFLAIHLQKLIFHWVHWSICRKYSSMKRKLLSTRHYYKVWGTVVFVLIFYMTKLVCIIAMCFCKHLGRHWFIITKHDVWLFLFRYVICQHWSV